MLKGLREEEQGRMQADQNLIPKGLRAERVSIERGSATNSVASVGPSMGLAGWSSLRWRTIDPR
jgi:hypothetical protein